MPQSSVSTPRPSFCIFILGQAAKVSHGYISWAKLYPLKIELGICKFVVRFSIFAGN